MAAKLLKMTNISKSFGSNKVLDGIEIEVDRGEVVALLGENGAGKSTLIKILGGIYHADTGSVYIDGEKKNIQSAADAGKEGIRIIHQEIVLVPDRTIAANVFLGREIRKNGLIDYKAMNDVIWNRGDKNDYYYTHPKEEKEGKEALLKRVMNKPRTTEETRRETLYEGLDICSMRNVKIVRFSQTTKVDDEVTKSVIKYFTYYR